MPVILRMQRRQADFEFKASLGYKFKPNSCAIVLANVISVFGVKARESSARGYVFSPFTEK